MYNFKEPGIILLDTSLITTAHEDSSASAKLFWDSVIASSSDRIKILIPIGVIRELIRHRDNEKQRDSLRSACSSALETIKQYQSSGDVTIYDDHMNLHVADSEVFADKSFINIVNAYKNKYNLYIATEDVDLMVGIWDTVDLECLSGKTKTADGTKRQTHNVMDVRVVKFRKQRQDNGSMKLQADSFVDFRPRQNMEQFASSKGFDLNRCLEIANRVSDTPVDAQTLARPFLQRAIESELGTSPQANRDDRSSDNRPFVRNATPRATESRQTKAPAAKLPAFVAFSGPFDRDKCIAVASDGSETKVKLKDQIGSGGEGFVFATNMGGVLAKVFLPGNATKNKYNKIAKLISGGYQKDGICFPTHLLLNERREFIGYLMYKAEGEALSCLLNPQVIKNEFPSLQRVDLVRLCINILDQILYLHKNDILMCDINNENILFANIGTPNLKTYFIDTDSYQVGDLLGEVGVPEYTPPEFIGQRLDQIKRTKQNEYFIVATLLFSIMLPGQKPYAHIGGTADVAEDIKAGIFPYAHGEEYTGEGAPSILFRRIWSHLAFKTHFWNTFHKQGEHHKVGDRYTVAHWLRSFQDYEKMLTNGTIADDDPEGLKVFPTDFKRPKGSTKICPYCKTNRIPKHYDFCDTCRDTVVEYRTCANASCGERFEVTRGMQAWERKNGARNKICPVCKGTARSNNERTQYTSAKAQSAAAQKTTTVQQPEEQGFFSRLFSKLFK